MAPRSQERATVPARGALPPEPPEEMSPRTNVPGVLFMCLFI